MGTVREVFDEVLKRDWEKTEKHIAGGGKLIIDSFRVLQMGEIITGNIAGVLIPLRITRVSTKQEQKYEMEKAQVEDRRSWGSYFYEVQAVD